MPTLDLEDQCHAADHAANTPGTSILLKLLWICTAAVGVAGKASRQHRDGHQRRYHHHQACSVLDIEPPHPLAKVLCAELECLGLQSQFSAELEFMHVNVFQSP